MNYTSEFTGPQIDERLGLAGTAYQKPETGIPAEDLSEGVNVSLEKAGTALQSVKTLGGENLEGSGNVPIVPTVGSSATFLRIKVGNTTSSTGVRFKTINNESIFGEGNIETHDVLNIRVGTTDPAIIAKVREFALAHKPVIAWDEEVPYYISYAYDGEDLVFTHYDVDSKWIYGYRVNDAETPITWSDADFNLSIVEALSIFPVTMWDDTEFIELDSHTYDVLRQADVVVDPVTKLYYKKNPALSPRFIIHNFSYNVPGTGYTIDAIAGAWANYISYEFMRVDDVPDVTECDILLLVTYDNGGRFGLIKIVV